VERNPIRCNTSPDSRATWFVIDDWAMADPFAAAAGVAPKPLLGTAIALGGFTDPAAAAGPASVQLCGTESAPTELA